MSYLQETAFQIDHDISFCFDDQVNGIQMTGKTQMEAVKVLREIPIGSDVILKVSRQTTVTKPKFTLPRELVSLMQQRILMMYFCSYLSVYV